MKRIAYLGLVLTTTSLTLAALAQGQAGSTQAQSNQSQANSQNAGPSLGDYARQIRKSGEPSAKPKVFDNDNLPTDDKLSVVGQTPEPGADNAGETKPAEAAPASGEAKSQTDNKAAASSQSQSQTQTATSGKPEDDQAAKLAAWKQWGEKIAGQKEQVDLLTRELTVLQREYQIRAAAMYGDVGNRLRNSGDWDKQDAQYKQQIADKQKQLDDANQKLADMQEEARKAGVPSSIAEP